MATRKTPAPKATAGDSAQGAHQPVDALVHKADERLFIPSREEAGQVHYPRLEKLVTPLLKGSAP